MYIVIVRCPIKYGSDLMGMYGVVCEYQGTLGLECNAKPMSYDVAEQWASYYNAHREHHAIIHPIEN